MLSTSMSNDLAKELDAHSRVHSRVSVSVFEASETPKAYVRRMMICPGEGVKAIYICIH
jgi:hypothetical protein